MANRRFQVWNRHGEWAFFEEGAERPPPLDGMTHVYTVVASSWEEGMTEYYKNQGWGEYKPMTLEE